MTRVHSKSSLGGKSPPTREIRRKLTQKGKQKTGMNERGNHLSAGTCSHIKQGHNKRNHKKNKRQKTPQTFLLQRPQQNHGGPAWLGAERKYAVCEVWVLNNWVRTVTALGVLENNVRLCVSAALKSSLCGVMCFQVVHTSGAAEVSRELHTTGQPWQILLCYARVGERSLVASSVGNKKS